ncbi:MAG: sulfurtransferase TusA family protein [Bacillaceae bacterium]|nr:sulfurtransferase TusA family protein [Bacillaceae bacterium]
MKADRILDIQGFACTMLIVKTKKAMDELDSGDVLEVHTSDQGSINDLQGWCESVGHEIIKMEEGELLKFWIKKGNRG